MLNSITNFNKENFYKNLANHPFCSNNFDQHGIFKKHKKEAVNYEYIQYNNDAFVSALVFDIDEPMGAIKWDFVNLPKPNIIMRNNRNGHAHLYYALKDPVCKTNFAKTKPLNYLSIIEKGLRAKLKADEHYTGLMTKNPLNDRWNTIWGNNKPYSLDYLRDFVDDQDIAKHSQKETEEYGIGRNVFLFNQLRKLAYHEVLFFKDRMNYECYEKTLYSKAVVLNFEHFSNSLLADNEVRTIVRSICRWTWRNFSREKFSEIQSRRAKLPRKRSLEFVEGKRNETAKQMANRLNISERTVRYYQKEDRADYLKHAENCREQAYVLRYHEKRSWKDIAETMGKTVSAVRALAHRYKKLS